MTSMFQSAGNGITSVVGQNSTPRINALKQGSVGKTMSDLQFMQDNERKQHQEAYNYENGHNDGSAPLGTASF